MLPETVAGVKWSPLLFWRIKFVGETGGLVLLLCAIGRRLISIASAIANIRSGEGLTVIGKAKQPASRRLQAQNGADADQLLCSTRFGWVQSAIADFRARGALLPGLFFAGLLALTGCDRPSTPATLESLGTPSALQSAEPRVNSVIRAGPDRRPIFE